jgi:hypothetical protein
MLKPRSAIRRSSSGSAAGQQTLGHRQIQQTAGRAGAGWIAGHAGVPMLGTVTMEVVNTAIVVAIVVTLMLLGIGMVTNQLLRLRKFLKDSPPDGAAGEDRREPPDQPS